MLSHLRFHRRAPSSSNPTSPLPEQAPAWDATAAAAAAAAAQREHPPQSPHDVSPRPDARQRSPSSSNFPPTLPPIARVASTGSDQLFMPTLHDDTDAPPPQETHPPPPRSTYDDEAKAGFIGGVALQNYRKAAQAPQANVPAASTMAGQLPETQLSRAKPPPPPIDTGMASRPLIQPSRQTKSSWFSTPTDLQLGQGAASKRPSGTRLASEPQLIAQSEPQKGRKGLPFLKNPMTSLLMRRKTAQSAADTQPAAPTYDPRIKGTRIHDFSAPRPKKTVSSDATSLSTEGAGSTPAKPEEVPTVTVDGATALTPTESPGAVDAAGDGQTVQGAPAEPGRNISSGTIPSERSVLLATHNGGSSVRTASSTISRGTQTAPQPATGSASVRTTASRHLSASRVSRQGSAASAIPKHMKSTSSRFSFDMIGAAEEERVLEERHRQREQEKKTDGSDGRFDEFDDDFDYDAMMDDDGLEERIPGVNADYEEEDYLDDPEAELDPDNDQENFAGFSFQRSNPVSSVTSPNSTGVLATPRDTAGNVVGFAMTKNPSPGLLSPNLEFIAPGISGVNEPAPEHGASNTVGDVAPNQSYTATTVSHPPMRSQNDDIYFDDGLADELDFEHDGTVFDESIFDNNDTDKYGRPIPGAFAQAKEAMQAAYQQQLQPEPEPKPEPEALPPQPETQDTQLQEQPQQLQSEKPPDSNRDSDITSGSGQSAPIQSTGQTSVSVGLPQDVNQADHEDLSLSQQISEPGTEVPGQDVMYQAALAEAAQMAAASGKFFRSTSPDVLAGLKDAPTDDLAGYEDEDPCGGYIDDYADEDVQNNFDDFDFDDDAIIAEANASALANDSDGFYGQEFGFYSAPISQQPSSNSHQPSSTGVLTTENLSQYGGFFGPASANINRSASGRVVREPNLTPITERSEYSNRNSIMSFTLPPPIGNGGSDRNSLTSPGLAQLALLAADDNDSNMSLTALMKLRSRAWGGSQPSLVSSREGSPRSERAPMQMPLDGSAAGGGSQFGTVPAHLAGHVRVGSGLSLWSCSEDAEDASNRGAGGLINQGMAGPFPSEDILPPRPGSAGAAINGTGSTSSLTGLGPLPQRPHSLFLPPQTPMTAPLPGTQPAGLNPLTCSPVLERDELDPGPTSPVSESFALAPALPVRRSEDLAREAASSAELPQYSLQQAGSPPLARRPPGAATGHRHKNSADSISYRKDEGGGETKWVVERRRTSESGEVEILERDVLEGGSI